QRELVPRPGIQIDQSQALSSGEPAEMVFPLKRADGEYRSFLTLVTPVKDIEGRVLRWIGTNTDVTDQRRTEEELRKANRELEEFAYVASHDLQEPLRMVNIYTQMILKKVGQEDSDLQLYARFVQQGVVRMETLIRDLLAFSRTVHQDQMTTATADLMTSLYEAKSVLGPRIEESGAAIHVQPLPTVRGDVSQITHVFQNLLSNALKYQKPDVPPEIFISAKREENQWVIGVRDNGIGFEQQYAERIFGLFKRLHGDDFDGTGLGLAICQRIIERHGGRIWAEGRPGDGATFYFTLPSMEMP
ncbi:MAG: ATP-binding protein, partial [Acidobacteriota bacterium]